MTRCPEVRAKLPFMSGFRVLFLPVLALFLLASCTGGSTVRGGSGVSLGEGKVLVASSRGRVFALSPQARQDGRAFPAPGEWESSLGKGRHSFYSSPLLVGADAYVGSYEGQLLVLDGATGQPREKPLFRGGSIVGGPVLGDNTIYLAAGSQLLALDPATGQARWTFRASDRIWGRPVLAGETLYVTSLDHYVYALRSRDGTLRWKYRAGGAMASSPVLGGGALFVGAFDGLYALDGGTGRLLWGPFATGAWFWGRPLFWGGKLFAGSLDGKLYTLDALTGQPLREPFFTGGPITASPVLEDGVLVVASDRVYGLDPGSGKELWPQPRGLGARVVADLVGEGGVVYVHAQEGPGKEPPETLWALKAGSGEVLWKLPLGR